MKSGDVFISPVLLEIENISPSNLEKKKKPLNHEA